MRSLAYLLSLVTCLAQADALFVTAAPGGPYLWSPNADTVWFDKGEIAITECDYPATTCTVQQESDNLAALVSDGLTGTPGQQEPLNWSGVAGLNLNGDGKGRIWTTTWDAIPGNSVPLPGVESTYAYVYNQQMNTLGRALRISSGGPYEILPGDVIDDQGAKSATVSFVEQPCSSGSWAGGDCVAFLYIDRSTEVGGAFDVGDTLDVGANVDVATVDLGTIWNDDSDIYLTKANGCPIDNDMYGGNSSGDGEWVIQYWIRPVNSGAWTKAGNGDWYTTKSIYPCHDSAGTCLATTFHMLFGGFVFESHLSEVNQNSLSDGWYLSQQWGDTGAGNSSVNNRVVSGGSEYFSQNLSIARYVKENEWNLVRYYVDSGNQDTDSEPYNITLSAWICWNDDSQCTKVKHWVGGTTFNSTENTQDEVLLNMQAANFGGNGINGFCKAQFYWQSGFDDGSHNYDSWMVLDDFCIGDSVAGCPDYGRTFE